MTTIPGDNWEMLTEVSSTALTIGFVIAVALYVVTYLSFVRLLRYPRNWCSPSLPLSLTTAGLVTITVSYVSVSSDGLDPVALAVSAGLIAVLFSIIAAPAVAFRPAPRWVEFLAKHGGLRGPVGARTCHRRLPPPSMSNCWGSWPPPWRSSWCGFCRAARTTDDGFTPSSVMTLRF